jgi:hypothetical protein
MQKSCSRILFSKPLVTPDARNDNSSRFGNQSSAFSRRSAMGASANLFAQGASPFTRREQNYHIFTIAPRRSDETTLKYRSARRVHERVDWKPNYTFLVRWSATARCENFPTDSVHKAYDGSDGRRDD